MEPLPKTNEAHNGDDRLSNLPDAIIHYIFSLSGLQIFDLVELGVLSKRWNRLWITMPYLDIDIDDFHLSHLRGVPGHHISVDKSISFINWVIMRQGQSNLVRFLLSPSLIIHEVQALRWLRVVAERNVQEVDIEFIPLGDFRLPLFIAVNDSLRLLSITLSSNVMQLPSVVQLDQLRSLELTSIVFPDTIMLQRLFSGCCSLESLRLNDCDLQSFGFLDFSSTHLKELIVCFNGGCTVDVSTFEIKVSCPSLISFIYAAPVAKNCILENVSSLKTAWIDLCELIGDEVHQAGHMVHSILKEVYNVTSLHCDSFVVCSLPSVIDELVRCPTSYPNLKLLTLLIATVNYQTRVMFHLLDHCPNLEVLTIVSAVHDSEWDDEYWELQYEGIVSWKSHPHLKAIKFVDFKGKDHELDFLRFLFKNAKNLEKMDIIEHFSYDISAEVIDKVLMFPKASSRIVVKFK